MHTTLNSHRNVQAPATPGSRVSHLGSQSPEKTHIAIHLSALKRQNSVPQLRDVRLEVRALVTLEREAVASRDTKGSGLLGMPHSLTWVVNKGVCTTVNL